MSDPQQLLKEALALAKRGQYQEARAIALQVYREEPRNLEALLIIANLTNNMTERRNALNQVLRIDPDNLKAKAMLEALRVRSTQAVATAEPEPEPSVTLMRRPAGIRDITGEMPAPTSRVNSNSLSQQILLAAGLGLIGVSALLAMVIAMFAG